MSITRELLDTLISDTTLTSKRDYQKAKNSILAKYRNTDDISLVEVLSTYRELIQSGTLPYDPRVWKMLRKRSIRSLSGVSVISLLTKFWGCPGKCVFCPTYDNLPKSYITGEPAVQRAEMNDFDPIKQVQNRLRALEMTGNTIAKCDVRIIGGTWSVYPEEYKESFIRSIYDAHTTYRELAGYSGEISVSENIDQAKTRNETAGSRVIGVAIETRPDWIDEEEIKKLRYYGITRVEIGYQTTIDEINLINKRGHGNKESIHATQLLKDAGYKVVAHMMPNLLGSTVEQDILSMKRVFDDPLFRPDEIKIYPMVVTPHSELEDIWKNGGFEAYDDETLIDLMATLQGYIPEYVRLNRMYRDIPADQILAGSKLANLRQLTEVRMKARGITRHDISAREIRAKGNDPQNAIMEEYFYEASGGHEYFLQYIDPSDRTIFGLLRLRIPSQYFTHDRHFLPALDGAGIIREVHVFGDQLPFGTPGDGSGQHMGFGKRLMARAEEIIIEKYPDLEKIAVIAGVGSREYYRKLGYTLEEEYMVKRMRRTFPGLARDFSEK